MKPKTQDQAFQKGKSACEKKHAGDRQGFNGCMQTLTRRLAPKGMKQNVMASKKKPNTI